jgi:hypothetical protein
MHNGLISILSLIVMLACGIKKDKNNGNNESQTDDSGSDVESVGEKISTDSAQSGVTILMADTPLPECTDKNRGQTFYVTAESLFRYCDSAGAWTVIDLKGPKGDTGSTGLPSTPGANWAMYSGTTRIGKVFTNALDVGMSTPLNSGYIYVQLEPRTFLFADLSQLSAAGITADLPTCAYFKSNDCSGICYVEAQPLLSTGITAPKIVVKKRDLMSPDNNTTELRVFDFNQIASEIFIGFRNPSTGTCQNMTVNPPTVTAVAGNPYTLPNGIAYPITNINFKAE